MAKTCRFCGTRAADNERICPNCKHEIVDTCTRCGTKLYNNEQYCSNCGTPVVVNCSGCGARMYSGEHFCPFCGTRNEVATPGMPAMQLPMTYGTPYDPHYGYGMPHGYGAQYGVSPIVLPPITLDGSAVNAPEAAVRTRPEPVEEEPAPKKCRLGIAGFILSLFSIIINILFFFGIPVSAVAIKKDKEHRGLAIAGLIIGIIVCLAWIAAIVWMFAFGGYDIVSKALGFGKK